MIEKLEKCPFCGEVERLRFQEEEDFLADLMHDATGDDDALDNYSEIDLYGYRVRCDGCGVLGAWSGSQENASAHWNRRSEVLRTIVFKGKGQCKVEIDLEE